MIPIGRERDFLYFGVSIIPDTQIEYMEYIHILYRDSKILKDIFKEVKKERYGKRGNPLIMIYKLDPPILWVIYTQDYWHMIFRSVFLDIDLFISSYQYWYYDWYTYHPKKSESIVENHIPDSSIAGISVAISTLNLNILEYIQTEKEK
jgi:hypothetical protein